jgi:hypothetical protein
LDINYSICSNYFFSTSLILKLMYLGFNLSGFFGSSSITSFYTFFSSSSSIKTEKFY